MTAGVRHFFDNAATSFPKPPEVLQAITDSMTRLGASPGRGAYSEASESARLLQQCRERLVRLINGTAPSHVIFTLNATDALNLAIKGIVHAARLRGDSAHVITSRMDHNSVLRPLRSLERAGVAVTRISADPETGLIDPHDIESALRPDTRLVALSHVSNVTGVIQPVERIGEICRRRGVPILLDAAQSLGHLPVDVEAMHIDLLAFPGHKGLLGPLGTGGLYIRPGLEEHLSTVREGGTGSASDLDEQPAALPDKYEGGSHNMPGIIGLNASVGWLLQQTVARIRAHELALIAQFLDGLRGIPNLRLVGPQNPAERTGVFSVTLPGLTPVELSRRLEAEHGILTRSGILCAPLAHATLGTLPRGVTRLSLGPFLDAAAIEAALTGLRDIASSLSRPATALLHA